MRKNSIVIIGSLTLILALGGCLDAKSMGVGRRPYLPFVAETGELSLEGDEQTAIDALRESNVALFDRLYGQMAAYRSELKQRRAMEAAYQKDAIAINRTIQKALGFEDDEIDAGVRAGLRKMGWPVDPAK